MATIAPNDDYSVDHDPVQKGFKLKNDEISPGANKRYGTDGTGTKGWQDYDASEVYSNNGFQIVGTPGISASVVSTGTYLINVPAGGILQRFSFEVDNIALDLTGTGSFVVSIDWNTAAFNLSRYNAVIPRFYLVDSGGVQRDPSTVAVTVTTTVAAGVSLSSLSNVNGLGTPVMIVCQI